MKIPKVYKKFQWDYANNETYYNHQKHVASFGYAMNVVIGQRGIRKSEKLLRELTNQAGANLDWKNMICTRRFVWMRLSAENIKQIKTNFFAHFFGFMSEHKDSSEIFEGLFIRIVGSQIYVSKKEDAVVSDMINIGEFVALSTFHQRSRNFPNGYNVHFDEFINEGKKMFDELEAQQLLFDSIIRNNKDAQIFLTANNITSNHPLLSALDVMRLNNGYIFINENEKKRILILKLPKNKLLAEVREDNVVGFLGKITGYNSFANDNKSKNDDITNIQNINKNHLEPAFKVRVDGSTLYLYWYGDKILVSQLVHNVGEEISLKTREIDKEETIDSSETRKYLVSLNYKNRLVYTNLKVKALFFKAIT